jgi:hypothetical protein
MRVGRSFVIVLSTFWSVTFGVSAAPVGGALAEERLGQEPRGAQRETERRAPIGPEEFKRLLQKARQDLQANDLDTISAALSTLGELGGRDAAIAVMERVRLGLPPHLTEQAVVVLSALNQPLTTPVLVELTLHRRWQVREKAVAALGALKVRSAVSVLLYSLNDPNAEVRSAAARSLGDIGDARALPALTTAAEHGVAGALLALAQLGNAKHVPVILAQAKKDLKASEPALRHLLARPNLHLSIKLQVVRAIQELATPDAAAVLAEWRSAFGKGTAPELLAALKAQGASS